MKDDVRANLVKKKRYLIGVRWLWIEEHGRELLRGTKLIRFAAPREEKDDLKMMVQVAVVGYFSAL